MTRRPNEPIAVSMSPTHWRTLHALVVDSADALNTAKTEGVANTARNVVRAQLDEIKTVLEGHLGATK